MKIAIDISQIVYETGVSKYVENLVENLLKIDHKNEYILFGYSFRRSFQLNNFKEKLSQYQNVSFQFSRYPISIFETFANKIRLISVSKMLKEEIDIYHSSDWIQPKLDENVLKVTTIHDMVPYIFPASLHKKILSTQKRRLNLVKKEVDQIIADSKTTKEDIVKFLDISEEKINVIYLAASGNFKPQDQEKVNAVLGKFKIKKPYILSVATQEPRKNIQKIIDTFSQIQKERPDLNLVLCGKYGWGSGFQGTDNLIWTDHVSDEDLVSLYCGARVFVYPSLYEGFGLPILEAMACGTPVITSNNSSMSEIGKDAAVLIDPRSDTQMKKALDLILDLNMENYQKMVRASLDRARQYSWIKTARETLKVYEDLYKKHHKSDNTNNKHLNHKSKEEINDTEVNLKTQKVQIQN